MLAGIISVEQDHPFIKKITKPMMGFKAFHSAKATIAGIETAHMIQKGRKHPSLPAVYSFSRIGLSAD
jgi:putative transposase